MKTLEEIKEHLSEVGYNKQAMLQIEAFLLGGGMIRPNEELEFIKGKGDFEDFMEWYVNDEEEDSKFDDDEFTKGDFIHVEDGIDVLCLSDLFNGQFVGTTGTIIHKYELTKDSRPCFEEEILKIEKALEDNGVEFCYDCDELEPYSIKEEEDIPSECLDCLEIRCKEAIENIVANLHGGEIAKEEKECLLDSLNVLAELGKMYE